MERILSVGGCKHAHRIAEPIFGQLRNTFEASTAFFGGLLITILKSSKRLWITLGRRLSLLTALQEQLGLKLQSDKDLLKPL